MTVEVEILSSNVEVLEKQPPLELLPFTDFIEITRCMYVKEIVTFQLLEVGGDPFYRGTFEKLNDEWTLEQDIRQKLNQLVKKKKMRIEQAEELFQKINIEPNDLSKKLNKKKLSNKKRPILNKSVRKPRSSFRTWSLSKHKPIYLKVGLIVVISVILFSGVFFVMKPKTTTAKKDISFEQLLSDQKFYNAIKAYPEKEQEIVEEAYRKEDKKSLEQLTEESKTELPSFYLAFLENDWKTVTSLKNLPQDSDILAMKGYAFLKQGKLEEAKLINKEMENKTLANQIKDYQKDQAYQAIHKEDIANAEKINKEINDPQLSEDIKIAKSIVNLLKKYQTDQNNKGLSENERKEASKNYELWKKNLQQVGNE
ncbi:hypothetical protein [Enterococcus faecalis]|uniref:hypothetical protein n=1 Tax=Enterococcus faecalis TaxID=1351 RepID=UPI001AD607D4|nr:hypothetical protein [Enterococcus faecalis]MBO6338644.1 hypothetical protein [Enterococcus faecalis]MBO6365070.1 hypothetical protein [Enterococcus faecalis]